MSARLQREANLLVAEHGPDAVIAALAPILGEARRVRLDEVVDARLGGVAVALENLFDPHNGGAALRSCEAFGLLEVHFVAQPAKLSGRVTQGCEKWLEIEEHATIEAALPVWKARGFQLAAAVQGAPVPLEALDPLVPTLFLLGNEHEGLSPAARAACDVTYALPMHGFSESVNLSVAAAITIYTHARRRRDALGRRGDLDPGRALALRASYYARSVEGAAAIVRRYRASADAGVR